MIDLIKEEDDKYQKFLKFLQIVIKRCKNHNDLDLTIPRLTWDEIEEFCKDANKLGLPVWYITEDCFACYPDMETLKTTEQRR